MCRCRLAGVRHTLHAQPPTQQHGRMRSRQATTWQTNWQAGRCHFCASSCRGRLRQGQVRYLAVTAVNWQSGLYLILSPPLPPVYLSSPLYLAKAYSSLSISSPPLLYIALSSIALSPLLHFPHSFFCFVSFASLCPSSDVAFVQGSNYIGSGESAMLAGCPMLHPA